MNEIGFKLKCNWLPPTLRVFMVCYVTAVDYVRNKGKEIEPVAFKI